MSSTLIHTRIERFLLDSARDVELLGGEGRIEVAGSWEGVGVGPCVIKASPSGSRTATTNDTVMGYTGCLHSADTGDSLRLPLPIIPSSKYSFVMNFGSSGAVPARFGLTSKYLVCLYMCVGQMTAVLPSICMGMLN